MYAESHSNAMREQCIAEKVVRSQMAERLRRRKEKGLPGFEEPEDEEGNNAAEGSVEDDAIAGAAGGGSTGAAVQSALRADLADKKERKFHGPSASGKRRDGALAEEEDDDEDDGNEGERERRTCAGEDGKEEDEENDDAEKAESETRIQGTVREDLVGTAGKKRAKARYDDADTDVAHDVRRYEEDTGIRQDDGEHIEPFSMENERKEGLIDDEGNFARLKNREGVHANDTWLMDEHNAVDPSLAQKAQQRSENLSAEVEKPLGDAALAKLKAEAVTHLKDGETMLGALKRLRPLQSAAASRNRSKRKRKGQSDEQQEQQQESAQEKQRKRQALERLTEIADTLFHNGEYDAYSSTKRQLQREAELYGGVDDGNGKGKQPEVGRDEGAQIYQQWLGSEFSSHVDGISNNATAEDIFAE